MASYMLRGVSTTRAAKISSENNSIVMELLVKLLSSKLEYAPRKLPEEKEIFEMDPQVTIQLGTYFVFLRDWLTVFPREQILVVRFEDYSAHLKEEITKVFDFLNLDPLTPELEKMVVTQRTSNTQENQYQKSGPMLSSTRDLLRKFYQPFNQKLASLLENEAFLWNKP